MKNFIAVAVVLFVLANLLMLFLIGYGAVMPTHMGQMVFLHFTCVILPAPIMGIVIE